MILNKVMKIIYVLPYKVFTITIYYVKRWYRTTKPSLGSTVLLLFMLSLSTITVSADLTGLTNVTGENDSCAQEYHFISQAIHSNEPDILLSALTRWYRMYKETGIQKFNGGVTEHINDINGNGVLDEHDSRWIYFNLGELGDNLYAVDLTNAEQPSIMWEINSLTPGFSSLAQAWSKPKVIYTKFNSVNEVAKETLLFAGGYDTNKNKPGIGTDDHKGNAIYMVDARTGKPIWSLSENGTTAFAGVDSIPSSVSILDSNGDGYVDRLYVGDTGGNVWRVNMPTESIDDITLHKLANLGRHANNPDQRFFYEPTIVRALIPQPHILNHIDSDGVIRNEVSYREQAHDVILLGSGKQINRNELDPSKASAYLAEEVINSFYMIKDSNIITFSKNHNANQYQANLSEPPREIVKAQLYDLTNNPLQRLNNKAEQESFKLALGNMSGWFINYKKIKEKTTSTAVVVNNRALFTTTSALSTSTSDSCEELIKEHWLYGVDMNYGVSRYNWPEKILENDKRIMSLGKGEYNKSKTIQIKNESQTSLETNTESNAASNHINILLGSTIIDGSIVLEDKRNYLYITEKD